MTHPGTPRDVNLNDWLDGIGFKPANTPEKQLGHEAARVVVAQFGALLHSLLPAGKDKSIVFTALEDVLMRANRALALGGPQLTEPELREMIQSWGFMGVPADPRIEEYKAEQRGEPAPAGGLLDLPFPVPQAVQDQAPADLFANRPPLGKPEA